MEISIRKGTKQDLPKILELIKELAEYEKAPLEVTVKLEELERDGFGNNPIFETFVAIMNNEMVGMAFYFYSYSTWKGKCVYLEDIIVKQKYRGSGIGAKLFEEVIRKSKEAGAKRMQWQVLNWNTPALNFYKKYNANLDETWVNGKLTEQQVNEFK
ncbi:MAG: GNAT family N-acetyltransferase [Bacteroidales bacterium]|nr:GNAT family N-acetyltransferase [Bacteroidales bacterium]